MTDVAEPKTSADLIAKTVNALVGDVKGLSTPLPGGTLLQEPEQREKDRVFLNDLAVAVVSATVGRARNDQTFETMVDAANGLFTTVAQFWYDQGYRSVGAGLRAFLKLPQDAPCDNATLVREVLKLVTGERTGPYLQGLAMAWLLDDETSKALAGDSDADAPGDDIDVSEDEPVPSLVGGVAAPDLFGPADATLGPFRIRTPRGFLRGARANLKLLRDIATNSGDDVDPGTLWDSLGEQVHEEIQMHYVFGTKHPTLVGSKLLTAASIAQQSPREWPTLLGSTTEIALWLADALFDLETDAHKQPDILDLMTHEVYEIKPCHEYARGYRQLFGYLQMLNTMVFLGDKVPTPEALKEARELTKKFLEALTGKAPATPTPKEYFPGTGMTGWRPAPSYPVDDEHTAWVMLMGPGLIGYELKKTRKRAEAKEAVAHLPADIRQRNLTQQELAVVAIIVVAVVALVFLPELLALAGIEAGLATVGATAGVAASSSVGLAAGWQAFSRLVPAY